MSKIGVVTDSNSSISPQRAQQLGVKVLAMPFYFGEECFYENVSITKDEFFRRLSSGENVSTSQPSPAEVMEIWDKALEEFDEIVYIPISSGLSGSCQTANMLAQEEPYEGKVYVVDNGRVATPQQRTVLDALELIDEGYSAADIKEMLEEARANMVIYVGVQTLENLKRGGRISPATAAIGTVLNIKPVLKFDVGTLDTFAKCRGFQKAKRTMIDAVRNDLNTVFKEWYDKGEAYLLAAGSAPQADTDKWLEEIREAFPGMDVLYGDLSFGTACHIGYGGLGIGVSCRPHRK